MKDGLSYAPSPETVEEEADEHRSGTADRVVSTLGPYVRRGTDTGALAGVAGVAALARSVGALDRGARSTAVRHALGAALWFTVAAVQRRSAGDAAAGERGESEETATVSAGAGGELVGGGEAAGTVQNTDALLEDDQNASDRGEEPDER